MPQLSLIKEKGVMRLDGITSNQILALLCERHAKDVIIPECKNGETWGARDLLKLDAWVLLRSYSPLTTIGYEIKCSRTDFEQDQKWVRYLDLCHLFYFVCPAGLIRAADLPARVGLIWVSSSNKLRVKCKPERVDPDAEKLNRLLIYALMARSKIVKSMYETEGGPEKDRLQLLRDAVREAKKKKELAYFVKGHVRSLYLATLDKDRKLRYREDTIKRFVDRLALLGITWDPEENTWQDTMRVENEIDLLKKRIGLRAIAAMRELGRQLADVADVIEKYRGEESRK